jgi:hypothetical protein
VANAALSCVMTAVPADPEKPEMNSRRASLGAMYSDWCESSEGTTKEGVSQHSCVAVIKGRTIDIYLLLGHELPQALQARGRVVDWASKC